MIVGFDHIQLYCGDIEKAVDYFRDIFDGKEVSREKRPNDLMIRMDVQGVIISFITVSPGSNQLDPGKGKRGFDHIGFKVKEIESTLEEMKKKGVRITTELSALPSGTKVAFVEGPEGVRIELFEKKEDTKGETSSWQD